MRTSQETSNDSRSVSEENAKNFMDGASPRVREKSELSFMGSHVEVTD